MLKATQKVVGVGPDAPTVVNDKGAKQSVTPYKFTDFDARHVLRVAAVSAGGYKKYGPRNYLGISTLDHIDHALAHINAFLAGDQQEDHLAHAICRLYFGMATSELVADPEPTVKPTASESCFYRNPDCPLNCRRKTDEMPGPLNPFDDPRNKREKEDLING